MRQRLGDGALDQLFLGARTHRHWLASSIDEGLLREAWELARMGPTSGNSGPGRIVFVVSAAAKEQLRPCLSRGNVRQTMSAPATAIMAYDLAFYDRLPELYPQAGARAWFVGNEPLIQETAFRNGTLQAAYFMIAARALGLDCGPMSGFDRSKVDEQFFAGTTIRSNFLCNLGVGDPAALQPRNPRLSFDDACRIV
jgi:3-hydroxypropanoate dehydrogenase